MRQNAPSRTTEPTGRDARDATSRSSRSIDEWLAAAVAEQNRRAAARGEAAGAEGTDRREAASAPQDPFDEPAAASPPSAASPSAITGAGVAEAAANPGEALGSVASWIERAQEQLAETTRAKAVAQEQTVTDAIGAIAGRLDPTQGKADPEPAPAFDALGAVERIEGAFGVSTSDTLSARPAADDDAFRSLEDRMREIAGRLDTARPRRGVSPQQEVEAAVAEIKSRQAQLDAAQPAPRQPAAIAPRIRGSNETELLAILRADMDRLAQRIEKSGPTAEAGLEALRRDIDGLHQSVAALAKREDLGAIEQSVSALAAELAGKADHAKQPGLSEADLERLQAQLAALSAAPGSSDDFSRLSRDIDVVSHKLDFIAASGVDPAATGAMSSDLAEIRTMLAQFAQSRDTAAIHEHLNEIKLDIARVGTRQVDAQDFASLRMAFEDLRDTLARPASGSGLPDFALSAEEVQQVTKDELQPIASMLVTLVDKIDRMERHAADPEMLEQLERQIAGLTESITDTAARDPSLGALNQAMADLTSEIANWRTSTIEIAERAARNAVAETLGSWNSQPGVPRVEPRMAQAGVSASPDRDLEFHAKLEDSVRRLGREPAPKPNLQGPPARQSSDVGPGAANASAETQARSGETALRRLNEALLLGPDLSEADHPLPRTPPDEVLLEPGSVRPNGTTQPGQAPDPDARDIKASFIAAARRAAQAAAADDKIKPARQVLGTDAQADDNSAVMSGRLRSMLERLRRPLLVSAAAIVVAIGGYRLVADISGGNPTKLAAVAPVEVATPTITAPSSNGEAPARSEAPEPTSTQSIPAPRENSAAAVQPSAETTVATTTPQPASTTPASGSGLAATPTPGPSRAEASSDAAAGKQSVQLPPANSATLAAKPPAGPDTAPASLSAGLRQAALNGDPVALFELAARTMEGRGVPRDPKAAVGLFEKAAEKNFAPAQYRTGNAYEKGIGVTRDTEVARRWYQRAAENGNVRAMHNLAVLMAEASSGKPDYTGAIGWFQRAAEQGLRDSQFNLAVLFARGLGTQQDLVKSYTWFAVAAAQGDEEAGRKREEVGARMQPADLARAKAAAERWRPTPANPAANDVSPPATGWSWDASGKRAARGRRV